MDDLLAKLGTCVDIMDMEKIIEYIKQEHPTEFFTALQNVCYNEIKKKWELVDSWDFEEIKEESIEEFKLNIWEYIEEELCYSQLQNFVIKECENDFTRFGEVLKIWYTPEQIKELREELENE